VFRTQEVCEIAQVQQYVLRSWEAEFPDLGVSKSTDGPRLYRRADVELVLKLKHLLFVDGLTLAGARRRLVEEGVAPAAPDEETITDADVAALVNKQTRKGLHDVRQGLGWILEVLNGGASSRTARSAKPVQSKSRLSRSSRPAKSRPVKAKAKSGRRPVGRKKR
jgi:DNA-binding transcriptional MerR regulator